MIKKAHCLFEQSGTFKNCFKALGIPAEDYDILNDFNETDHVIDLYSQIDLAFARERERERVKRFLMISLKMTLFWLSFLALGSRLKFY